MRISGMDNGEKKAGKYNFQIIILDRGYSR